MSRDAAGGAASRYGSDAGGNLVEHARQVPAQEGDRDDDDEGDEGDHQAVLHGGGAALGQLRLELGDLLAHDSFPIPAFIAKPLRPAPQAWQAWPRAVSPFCVSAATADTGGAER